MAALREQEMLADPLDQFEAWLNEALELDLEDATAMTLATADSSGAPSCRIVLLKRVDDDGFHFFTDYRSRKARELEENPRAALAFFWRTMERQVRILGDVERVDREESEAYFRTRPRESRLSTWASHQSSVISGRETLEKQYSEVAERFEGQDVPLPAWWGGYRVRPASIEFWQGRSHRLHDRLRYTLEDGRWQLERLAP